MWYFSLQCFDTWLGDRKGIRPLKKLDVGLLVDDDLTGALHDL